MSTATRSPVEQTVEVASCHVRVLTKGAGDPLLVLHDDVGTPGWLPFCEELASSFSVYLPSLPGFDGSERPEWMRDVRDMAIVHNRLLGELGLGSVSVVGLGFGGWIAAEMATMAPRRFERMVLVGAVGVQPREGEIADQFLVSGEEHARLGFHDPSRFEEVYGSEPSVDQRETWEINREMTTRIAWKPYMFDQTLPFLLVSVDTPTLIVLGGEDRIVPPDCGRRYHEALPNARLEVLEGCGHRVDVEKPEELAALVKDFVSVA